MIRLIILIAFTYGIAWIPYYCMLDDQFITIYIRDIQYCILIAYCFDLIPKKDFAIRSIMISWFIFCVVESQQYFILQYNPDSYFNTYLITTGTILAILIFNILIPRSKSITYIETIQRDL